jgi:hypothetical protein
MNDTQTKIEELKSTVSAFTDWLNLNSDDYMMVVSKGGGSILAANGKNDNIVKALVCGMMEDENLQNIILEAARMIVVKRLINKLKNNLK